MTTERHVLVTGATRGLGRELVRHFLEAGDVVIGCGRSDPSVVHERYTHVSVDVTDESAVRALFGMIRQRFGRLDCLVNNAGVASMNPIALTPLASARRLIETNFLGTFLFTHAGIRLLRSSPAGRIVNVSTVAVPLRLEGEAVYASAKSAVETFTRITAKEVGRMGITCNAVGPSPVRTGLIENVPEAKLQALIDRQSVPCWAEPVDVINVVDFFLKPESRLVTGQVVYLGGAG
jgi:3-oxoacyl-[acyl-carrier protein] reductase